MRLELESTIVSVPPLQTSNTGPEPPHREAEQALNEGIKAAQAGDRAAARAALMRAVGLNPRCEKGWLWLASISEYPEELLVFLNNVLDVNPENPRALEWMAATKRLLARSFIQRGRDALEERLIEFAAECFEKAIQNDPQNGAAWRSMSSVAATSDERIRCLERAYEIEPADDLRSELDAARSEAGRKLLAEAKSLAVAGRRDEAVSVLASLTASQPELTEAWILRSHLVDSFEEKLRCFEAVLSHDPANPAALAGRESLLMFVPSPSSEAATDHTPDNNMEFIVEDAQVITADEAALTVDAADVMFSAPAADFQQLAESAADTEFGEMFVSSPQVAALCSFCRSDEVRGAACGSCGGVQSLSDLDVLLGNASPDRPQVRAFIEKMENERAQRTLSAGELVLLGTAHLNVGNRASGYACIYDAAQMEPANDTLGRQANDLLVRLEDGPDAPKKAKTILVVDDSPTVRKLIAGKLEKCGHEVFCSNDGVEAMELLEGLTPDLVLLDITMPRMDGYQVCKLIRSKPDTANIPVVMISGKDGFFDKVRGRMSGATGYITKPFGPEALMKAVDLYLSGSAPEFDQ